MNKKLEIRAKLYAKYLMSKKNNEYEIYNNSKQKIIVALAADYGNLGDVAITYAQTKFLKSQYPNADIIDFPISRTFSGMKSLKSIIKPNDIITIVGGGNTTDLYDDIEYCRQFIIKQFPNNKIICFPQTICFSDTSYGKKALEKAIKVYSKHKDLTLSAREMNSFNKYKEMFSKNRVVFAPDIVLSLDESDSKVVRSNITFCLRSDKEKSINGDVEKEIINMLSKNYEIKHQDTHIEKNKMPVDVREEELHKIWGDFKKSSLVITDRLHGMIFCAITKTPCIAFDNSTKKVSGVFNAWLKEFTMIKLINDSSLEKLKDEIKEIIDSDLSVGNVYFNEYTKIIKS